LHQTWVEFAPNRVRRSLELPAVVIVRPTLHSSPYKFFIPSNPSRNASQET
jgi:hypothetical protein